MARKSIDSENRRQPENEAEQTAAELPEEMTIEETFDELDELIDLLESGSGSLEDAFRRYERGMKLVKSCNEKIEKIEKQIQILSGEEPECENDGQQF